MRHRLSVTFIASPPHCCTTTSSSTSVTFSRARRNWRAHSAAASSPLLSTDATTMLADRWAATAAAAGAASALGVAADRARSKLPITLHLKPALAPSPPPPAARPHAHNNQSPGGADVPTVYSRTFNVSGPRIWNGLLEDVVSAPTFSSFQRWLKPFLCQQLYPDIII